MIQTMIFSSFSLGAVHNGFWLIEMFMRWQLCTSTILSFGSLSCFEGLKLKRFALKEDGFSLVEGLELAAVSKVQVGKTGSLLC